MHSRAVSHFSFRAVDRPRFLCLAILLLARTPFHYENYISFKFQVERIYANISTGKIRKYWRKIIIKKLGDDKIANNIDDDVDDDDA